MAPHLKTSLATDALGEAIATRGGQVQGVVFHTDRGPQYMVDVVDLFDGSVGCSSAGGVGQGFFSPGDDGVHDFVVFGDLAAVVAVCEPSQGLVGSVEVVGFVGPVEFL